ncbi:MAG: molybdopterin-dependent oxidoreductase, partial [Chloroflexi bacterium]|nr:molybdopterin-dependent oxidoreductase [Chloroflexota bacterium]
MSSQNVVTKKGSCPACGTACQVLVHIADGRVVGIDPDPESRISRTLCERVVAAADYHDHPKRLNYPLKRKGARGGGEWQQLPWEQAMDEIAAKLGAMRTQYGPEAVLVLGGALHGPGDPACWKWCNLWGTPNFFHLGKNCGESEYLAECAVYGYDTMAASVEGVNPDKTKVGMLWGSNPANSMPPVWRSWLRAKKAGTKIIVVDPRPTACTDQADIWLQLRPGTDGALALGMLNVIINEGLYDKQFVKDWCLGFEGLRTLVQGYPPDKVAQITWVPAEKLAEAARLYASSPASILTFGVANCHLGKGAGLSSVLGKCWLRAITGNVDREGGNRFSDPPQHAAFLDEVNWGHLINHPHRTRDNVSSSMWPIASVSSLDTFRKRMAKVNPKGWGASQYMVYPAPTSVLTAILEGQPYPIKAVIAQGTNPLCSMGHSRRAYRALKSENLDLHVSMDHFMTPTAALADYVLPATDALERPNLGNMWGMSD